MDQFVLGGLAAGLSILFVNPMDVVKSRMQMQGEGGKGLKVYSGPFNALKSIAVKEGIAGLYRGFLPSVMFQMVGNSTRFGVYYYGKSLLGADNTFDPRTNFILALTAGGLAGLISCPFFTLKTQLQVQSNCRELGAVGTQHDHRGFIDAVRNVVKVQGVRGLYAGLNVFFIRCVALVGAQMTTYDFAKHHLIKNKLVENGVACHIVSSAIAAGAACICMQPMDLIGSRLMNQPVDPSTGMKLLYSGPIDCLRKTVIAEGPLGLYKGVFANYMRMGPQYILTFVFYEKLTQIVKEYRIKN